MTGAYRYLLIYALQNQHIYELMDNQMPHLLFKENPGLFAVILVSFIFILSRLAIPIIYNGSYIDEYWHITSGVSLFESANYAYFYNDGAPYDRGLLMSLWVGFWMALFGKSLLIAKLAPISIGIINYFLLLYLSIKLVNKRRFQILLLLLYTLSPLSLFNHSYIRMYVVYELFLLVLLVLGYKLYIAVRDANGKNIALFLSLVVVLNILNLTTNTDSGKYILLVASAVMLATLFIFEFNAAPNKKGVLIGVLSGSLLLSTKLYRATLIMIIAALAFIFLDAGAKIEYLMNAQLTHSSLPDAKYTWFFLEINGIITLFFILAVATFWKKNNGYEKIILPVAGVLFIIHLFSSTDLQIIRGIMYFLPLYYLTAVIGVSKVRYPSKWIWYVVIGSAFLIATVSNVQKSFLRGPMVRGEIHYIGYSRLYDSVIENCQDSLIVEAAPLTPFIAKFYGVKVDFALSTADNAMKDSRYFSDADTGKFKTVWGAVPVITDIYDLKLLNRDVCLIVRAPSKNNFLPSTAETLLQNAEKSWHFSKMDLYLLKQKILTGN